VATQNPSLTDDQDTGATSPRTPAASASSATPSATSADAPRLSGSARTQQKVDQVIDQAQEAVGPVVEGAQEKVGQVVDQAKQQTTSLLASRKDQAAGTLYTVAHALRQTGQQLREQEQAPVAGLVDQAATQVENVSGYLHGRDVRQLVDETEDFARQRPAVFVGGALALGVLAARFLKSSRRKATTPPGQTIPVERALVEATPPPTDQSADATTPVSTNPAASGPSYGSSAPADQAAYGAVGVDDAAAPVRVTNDELIPPVVADGYTGAAGTTGAS